MEQEKKSQQCPPILIWIEDRGASEVHYCPQCGAILDDQEGFQPDLATWVCTDCHQMLYGDVYDGEAFPGVLWFCDGCGDLLNRQKGFHDTIKAWKCLKCGHIEHFDLVLEYRPPCVGDEN